MDARCACVCVAFGHSPWIVVQMDMPDSMCHIIATLARFAYTDSDGERAKSNSFHLNEGDFRSRGRILGISKTEVQIWTEVSLRYGE